MIEIIYEIYYKAGDKIVYCGDATSEEEAIREVDMLSAEWSDHDYWYEKV